MLAQGLSVFAVIFSINFVIAAESARLPTLLQVKIKKEIQKKFSNAEIEILPVFVKQLPDQIISVKYISESPLGIAEMGLIYERDGALSEKRVKIPFKATLKVAVAAKRLKFGQNILADDYFMQEIDVTSGLNREILGLLITSEERLSKMQAHQTLIENQPILSSALIATPDVARGDAVLLKISSGGLLIQTQGQAQEPSNIGQSLKVLSLKTKRELSGVLREGNTVEVQL